MSKELIEKLREGGKLLGWEFGKLMHEAADALEAKAAPVGEREAFEAFWKAGFVADTTKDLALMAFQSGAAYQRGQQPQSAEAVAWAHYAKFDDDWVMQWPPYATEHDAICDLSNYGAVYQVEVRPLYTTPHPSAGVVMPERKQRPYGFTHMPSHYEGWNACLDEFARLNGEEVGRG